MRYLCLAVAIFVSTVAWATKPTPTPSPQTSSAEATQQQGQEQAQSSSQSQTQTATGGAGGTSSAASSANGSLTSSNDYTSRTTAVALANTAPAPLHDTPQCYLPAKGIRRVRQALYGAVTLDSRLVRDDGCMADLEAQRVYARDMAELELKRLALSIDRDRIAIERMRAERELPGVLAK